MNRARNRWLVAVICVLAAALLAFVVLTRLGHTQPTDCDSVHALNSYNNQFHDKVAHGLESNNDEATTVQEYREWASELHRYASAIREEGLREKAESVADLADHYVAVVPQLQADLLAASDTAPPSSAAWKEGGRIGHQFNEAVVALAEACPS